MSDNPITAGSAPATDDAATDSELEPIRIEMDKRVDLVILLAFAAFGVMTVYLATGFRLGGYPDPVTARGLPYFTGTYLVIAGLFLAARRIITWSDIPGIYTVSEGKEDEPGRPSSWVRSFTMIAIAALWAYSLRYAGFLIATPAMLFAMLWMMEVRSRAKLIVFPLCLGFGTWFVFSQILGVVLPLGVLTPLARSWGLTP